MRGERSGCGQQAILGQEGGFRRAREADVSDRRLVLTHLPLCPCPDDELPREGGERTTSPPCQLGKPRPGDARMCCIALPWQLASHDAEAGECGVTAHESRGSSDLGPMRTDKEQRCARQGQPPGLWIGIGHCHRGGRRGGGWLRHGSSLSLPPAQIRAWHSSVCGVLGTGSCSGAGFGASSPWGCVRVRSAVGLHQTCESHHRLVASCSQSVGQSWLVLSTSPHLTHPPRKQTDALSLGSPK